MIKQTYLILIILLGVWLTACQDFEDPANSQEIDGNRVEVSIKTNVPAITVQTKAEASEEEKCLQHVDVLVFKVENDGKEVFAYRTTHTNDLSGVDNNNETYIKTRLKVSEDDEEYRIVFIANLKDVVNTILTDNEGTPFLNKEKEELLQEITFTQEKKWLTEENTHQVLPMWGEAPYTTKIDKNITTGSFGSIHLIRSVARIEMGVNLANNDNGETFKISEVRIHNARQEGLAAPLKANFNITSKEVTAPSLTANTSTISKSILTYQATDNKVTGMYVNEALNKNEANDTETDTPLFLIIKASYKNGADTYYKVGFYDTNANNIPVDILRNFTYNMTVTGVDGPGEETEDKAIELVSGNLTVAMTDWSDCEMQYVVFNGQYYLGVSENKKTIPKTGGKYDLQVRTNYPSGWTAKIDEGTWLSNVTTASTSTGKAKIDELSFTASTNDAISSRKGIISISCGNQLNLEVEITQTAEEGISLKIQVKNDNDEYVDLIDNTLLFHSGNHYEIEPRELKVTWTPASENLVIDFERSFDWDDVTNLQTTYSGGEVELKIAPARMLTRPENNSDPLKAWFPSEETDIKIQVGGDSSSKQTISVKKQHYEVYLDRVEKYKLDGEKHSFKLYSNSPSWTARFIDTGGIREYIDIDHIPGQDNPPTGGNNVENGTFRIENGEVIIEDAGESIEFILKKPTAGSSINAEVLIQVTYDDSGKEIVKEYTFRAYYEDEGSQFIAGGDANCYMLKPGGKKIHIPVSQANRVPAVFGMGQQIKDDTKLTPYFIWTDHPGGLGIKSQKAQYAVYEMNIITPNNKSTEAILEVTPGNAAGNAVIGIKNEAGEILWSWHLWVSDFDPVNVGADRHTFRNYQFLDRNLGALSDDPAKQESFGLYYQWGRKDPFPSAKASRSSEFVPIYNELGTQIYMTSSPRGDAGWGKTPLLKESIRNPLNFITSGEWWCTGDFGTYGNETLKFWSENETNELETATKGVFDPCPDGWKTVPASTTSNNKEWYVLFNACTYETNGHYSKVEGLGVWPHVGAIGCNSATIIDPEMGRYWTGNRPDLWSNPGIHFLFSTTSSASHPSQTYSSSSGLPVRCMRRTDEMR